MRHGREGYRDEVGDIPDTGSVVIQDYVLDVVGSRHVDSKRGVFGVLVAHYLIETSKVSFHDREHRVFVYVVLKQADRDGKKEGSLDLRHSVSILRDQGSSRTFSIKKGMVIEVNYGG